MPPQKDKDTSEHRTWPRWRCFRDWTRNAPGIRVMMEEEGSCAHIVIDCCSVLNNSLFWKRNLLASFRELLFTFTTTSFCLDSSWWISRVMTPTRKSLDRSFPTWSVRIFSFLIFLEDTITIKYLAIATFPQLL